MKQRSAIAIAAFLAFAGLARAQVDGGTLDPTSVPKYVAPMVIPPAMPMLAATRHSDLYDIAVRQFEQQILPSGYPATTVWSYGARNVPGTVAEGGSFNYPALTIEARWRRPVVVRWVNELVDAEGNYLPHLLAVDQTLHWANPPGSPDTRGSDPTLYTGPVPMITHVHGAKTYEESDGYPEAWYLPDALDLPTAIHQGGSMYDTFRVESPFADLWGPGRAVFRYPNDQRPTTLWYHDHSLGMTRQNVYAGPAGFWLLRGGPQDSVRGSLPKPAPQHGDEPGMRYLEIPIVIQDRSFDDDGQLFYPDNRAFFEGLDPDQLQIPFAPDSAVGGASDVAPFWNPEFFGNTMVVNGVSWPYLDVEQRRYRIRFLNGCNSRFLILKCDGPVPFWQIGAEGGFLPAPVELQELLVAPAERADVIMDFSDLPRGTTVTLLNIGPDTPFGGGEPGVDFDPADPGTTGQVMQFRVGRRRGRDRTSLPQNLVLPPIERLGDPVAVRTLSLNEEESKTVYVTELANGDVVFDPNGEPFGPTAALLGTLNPDGTGNPLLWGDDPTELPLVGDTEVWEIHNFTADAHPIHIHLVQFEVVERETEDGTIRGPEAWETGYKDTVISYPTEITRVKARFDLAGLFVWHCHILEHEDNEMMRPYRVQGALPIVAGGDSNEIAALFLGSDDDEHDDEHDDEDEDDDDEEDDDED